MSTFINEFLSRQIKYRRLRPQLFIALLAGVAFSLDIFGFYSLVAGTQVGQVYGGIVIILGVLYTAIPFVVWFGASTAIFAFARLLGARVDFGILFRTTGWGVVPLIGAGVSLGGGRYFAIRDQALCSEGSPLLCRPETYRSLVTLVGDLYAFLSTASADPVFRLGYLLAVGFILASVYLWVIATHRTSTFTRAGAIVAVVTPASVTVAVLTIMTF